MASKAVSSRGPSHDADSNPPQNDGAPPALAWHAAPQPLAMLCREEEGYFDFSEAFDWKSDQAQHTRRTVSATPLTA